MPDIDKDIIIHIYDRFNARDIDGVLATLTDDVAWANGMEGGHVHGHAAVHDYWTRQWAMFSPHVEPVAFRRARDGAWLVEVIQKIYDLDGRPLEQALGLKDKTVLHIFHVRDGRIARFDIGEVE